MQPNLREHGWLEVTLQNDRAGVVVVVDLARDHGPGLLLRRVHLAVEGEAELGITLVHADRAPLKGVTDEPATGRLARAQDQNCGHSHPGCADPPGDAPMPWLVCNRLLHVHTPVCQDQKQRTWSRSHCMPRGG